MKKTLIALAAVAATSAAFAQNATISGNLNINAVNNSKMATQAGNNAVTNDVKTRASASGNGWTASEVRLSGNEDLGGGLTASFAIASGVGGTTGNRDAFLQLGGDFGSVRIGRFTPTAAMGFHGFSGARTSNQAGTIYGLGSATPNTSAGGATQAQNFGGLVGGTFERNSNNVQYASPDFNGFTFTVNYGTSSTDSSRAGSEGKNETRQSGLGIAYASGPLSVGFGMQDRKVRTEAIPAERATVAGFLAAIGSLSLADLEEGVVLGVAQRTQKSDLDWIGASYDLGVAKITGTHVKRKGKTTNAAGVTATNDDTKVNSIGVSVPVGAFTLAASTYRGKNKRTAAATDDAKLNGHQLSVTYELSKRTVVYAAMGKNQVKRDGSNVRGTSSKFTSNAVGVMHSF